MPRPHQDTTSDDQLTLALPEEGNRGPIEARGLFSKTYLNRQIRSSSHFASPQECAGAYALVCRLVREHGDALRSAAPGYLRPIAQWHLIETSSDGLEEIEKSVNWEAEKLYGVEGQGSFDEL